MDKVNKKKVALKRELLTPRKVRKILDSDFEKQFLKYLKKRKRVQFFCITASRELNNLFLNPCDIVNELVAPSKNRMLMITILSTYIPERTSKYQWKVLSSTYMNNVFKI